jgi:hypothetical protein
MGKPLPTRKPTSKKNALSPKPASLREPTSYFSECKAAPETGGFFDDNRNLNSSPVVNLLRFICSEFDDEGVQQPGGVALIPPADCQVAHMTCSGKNRRLPLIALWRCANTN